MEVFSQIILCLAVLILVAAGPFDQYCARDLCPAGALHIGCHATVEFAPLCPEGATLVEPNSKLKEFILDRINQKRNFIAGGQDSKHRPACRMATTQWDDELAALAAVNARKCKMAHDSCHNTKTFPLSGQLIAFIGYTHQADDNKMFETAINMWYKEVHNSNMTFINNYPANHLEPFVGHFTALISERNNHAGCAASKFPIPDEKYFAYLIVCNLAYNNVVNEPVYVSCKSSGSKCKSGKNEAYPNLCSISEEYEMTPEVRSADDILRVMMRFTKISEKEPSIEPEPSSQSEPVSQPDTVGDPESANT